MAGGFLDRLKAGLSRTADAVANLLARPMDTGSAEGLRERLLAADFGPATADEVVAAAQAAWKADGGLRQAGAAEAAAAVIERALTPATTKPLATGQPLVVMLLGVNGAGKTTTAAKLAWRWQQEGRTCLLGACDTFRAAAGEQLSAWADRLGVEVVAGGANADPAAVAFDAAEAALSRGVDVLLIDTAGRLHTQDHLMRQLTKVRDVVRRKIPNAPHEVLLVLDATSGQNAIQQAQVFKQAVDVTGIFLAKLDGTARGGVVVAIRDAIDVPVKLVGTGETPEDVQPFDPDQFVEAMFSA